MGQYLSTNGPVAQRLEQGTHNAKGVFYLELPRVLLSYQVAEREQFTQTRLLSRVIPKHPIFSRRVTNLGY